MGSWILLVLFLDSVMWIRNSFYFCIFTPFVPVARVGKGSISLSITLSEYVVYTESTVLLACYSASHMDNYYSCKRNPIVWQWLKKNAICVSWCQVTATVGLCLPCSNFLTSPHPLQYRGKWCKSCRERWSAWAPCSYPTPSLLCRGGCNGE